MFLCTHAARWSPRKTRPALLLREPSPVMDDPATSRGQESPPAPWPSVPEPRRKSAGSLLRGTLPRLGFPANPGTVCPAALTHTKWVPTDLQDPSRPHGPEPGNPTLICHCWRRPGGQRPTPRVREKELMTEKNHQLAKSGNGLVISRHIELKISLNNFSFWFS